jgi:hypothetical protein
LASERERTAPILQHVALKVVSDAKNSRESDRKG